MKYSKQNNNIKWINYEMEQLRVLITSKKKKNSNKI